MNKIGAAAVLIFILFLANDAMALVLLTALITAFMIYSLIQEVDLDKSQTLLLILGVVFLNNFIFAYNRIQNFIPFWDYAGYYIETLDAGKFMQDDLPTYIKSLYHSILESDYTKMPAFFAAPFLKLLGKSYAAFITVNFNLFLVPFFIVFGILIRKIDKRLMLLMFFFPPFLNPLLRGYIDCAGLIFSAVWLYIIHDDFEGINIKRNVILAVLTLIFIFTRRWYLFFVVSAFFALGVLGFARLLWDRRYNVKNHMTNLLITGGTLLFLVAVFFFPYLKRVVTNNFSDIYSAYQFGGFWWNVKYFIAYYGVITAAMSAAGAVAGLISRKTRGFTLFLIIQGTTMFLLFTRVQTISYHHQYLFAPIMFILIVIGISVLRGKVKITATFLAVIVICTSFVYSYTPIFKDSLTKYGFTAKRFEPKTANTENIILLRDKLNELTEENDSHVYILASSEILNDDILRNSSLPYERNALNNLFGTAHVDKRDGFPNSLLVSKYIVVATPLQVHLGEENQRVVEFFVRHIESGELTSNLEKIDSIPISDQVNADIYRRNEGYSPEFLNAAKEYFTAAYPDHPTLHDIDLIYSQN